MRFLKWLLFNIFLYLCTLMAFALWIFRGDPISAIMPLAIVVIGVVLQPWLLIFLFFAKSYFILIGLGATALLSTFIYQTQFVRELSKKVQQRINKQQRIKIVIGYVILSLIVLTARYLDWPHIPSSENASIKYVVEHNQINVHDKKQYNLGGFIDRDYLWKARLDTKDANILIDKLGLNTIEPNQVSPLFFKKPPYWWNPAQHTQTRFFKSPNFIADSRGVDGSHYMVMIDDQTQYVYLWIKDNF